MPELTADLFVSLDGFAAGADAGPFFGYGGPELDRWVRDRLNQPHLILMGRVTYFSNTLSEPLAWQNTRLISGDLGEQVRALKRESRNPVRSIGSLTLVRGLLGLGLVDRLRVTIFPLLLGGDGREPAYAGYPRTGLDLVGTRVLDSRIIMVDYRPSAPPTWPPPPA
jgi:dihydrofolate reductase